MLGWLRGPLPTAHQPEPKLKAKVPSRHALTYLFLAVLSLLALLLPLSLPFPPHRPPGFRTAWWGGVSSSPSSDPAAHAHLLSAAAAFSLASRPTLAAALAASTPLPPALAAPAWALAAADALAPATPAIAATWRALSTGAPFLVFYATTVWGEKSHKWGPEGRLFLCPPRPPATTRPCGLAFYGAAHAPLWPRAHLALYHRAPGPGEHLLPPPLRARGTPLGNRSGTLHALFAAENFKPLYSPAHMARFEAEVSYRRGGLWRNPEYELLALDGSPGWGRDAATWDDLFPPPVPYSERFSGLASAPPPPPPRKAAAAFWATSHCGSRSGREELVAALQDLGVGVDVGGVGCLSAPWRFAHPLSETQLNEKHPWPLQGARSARYKFLFAFENTLCEDYVTEKAFLALARGVVPVVLGAPNAHLFLPAGSYINVRDFPTASSLAAKLKELDANATAFAALLAWRSAPFAAYGAPELQRLLAEMVPLHAYSTEERFSCSLCYALEEGAEAGVYGAGRNDTMAGEEHLAAAAVRPFRCEPPLEVAEDGVGTLRFTQLAASPVTHLPPVRSAFSPRLRRALEALRAEKEALGHESTDIFSSQ